ncbi:hypothetical protein [Microbacterium paludicola]|uniref:hypothetical protein n=1 Tax=Microbacterium paludicola TaxID=300019 RepID=UPI0011AA1D62|nr:hypothetical protein [Microbacterium paludicola]
MNATNRAVNRGVLLVVGAVLIAVGGGGAAAALWPVAAATWQSSPSSAIEWMHEADRASRLSEESAVSWFVVGILAALLLIAAAAVLVMARLGGGRSSTVLREEASGGAHGAITIHPGFASDAITHSLNDRDEILACRVAARRVRGADVLHVSVTPRKNTSPIAVANTVTRLVDNLAALTGRETPTLVSIHAGVRSRLAADHSRVASS